MDESKVPKNADAELEVPVEPTNTVKPSDEAPSAKTSETSPVASALKPASSKNKKPKTLVLIIFGLVMLLGGGAAAYNTLVLNSPDKIWERALSKTHAGLDKFVEKTKSHNFTKGTVEGKLNLKSPVSIEGTFSGEFDEKNSSAKAEVTSSGITVNSEVRLITEADASTPKIYLNVSGLESVSPLLGAEFEAMVTEVNGTWFYLDPATLGESLGVDSSIIASPTQMASSEELLELQDKSMDLLYEWFFTAKTDRAVVEVEEYVGKEVHNGAQTHHYKVKVNKDNAKGFLGAFKKALEGTQFADAIDVEAMSKTIDEPDFPGARMDVWIDLKDTFIRNIRFSDDDKASENASYFEISVPYAGGDIVPMELKFYSGPSESSKDEVTLEFKVNYNQETGEVELALSMDGDADGTAIEGTMSITVSPTDKDVKVEAPEGARDILELLGPLLLGGGITDSSTELSDEFEFSDDSLDDVEL